MDALLRTFQEAVELHRQRRWKEAEQLYDRILSQAPSDPDTVHLRGLVALEQGRFEEASGYFMRCATRHQRPAMVWAHLGQSHLHSGRIAQARQSFEKAVELDPNSVEGHEGLGEIHRRAKNWDEACREFRAAAKGGEPSADRWCNLAVVAIDANDLDLAEMASRRALEIEPNHQHALFNLARFFRTVDRLPEAKATYSRLLDQYPDFTSAIINLANINLAEGDAGRAVLLYRRSLHRDPQDVSLLYGLAVSLHEADRVEEAMRAYDSLLKVDPSHISARENKASLLRRTGRYDEANRECEAILASNPKSEIALLVSGNINADVSNTERAIERFRALARLKPDDWMAELRAVRPCPLVFPSTDAIMEYRAQLETCLEKLLKRERPIDLSQLGRSGCESHFNWPFMGQDDRPLKEAYARLFIDSIPSYSHSRRGVGRVRVGIIVTDGNEPLFLRSMGDLLSGVTNEVELILACSKRGRSLIESGMQRRSLNFVMLTERFDSNVDALVHASLDIAYFWEVGTDSMNYFLPFARVAPIQCTSWGIQVTSGIPAMDYYVGSRWVEPQDGESHYSEKLIRLDTLLSRQRRRSLPESEVSREEFGFRKEDHLYVCPQNLGKFHPDFDEWIRMILEADPKGILVVTGTKHGFADRLLWNRLERTLSSAIDRVRLLPYQAMPSYYRLLSISDVVLDPPHFGGVNTTYDAISFGKPIVTLPSRFHRGRFTAGCLTKMGMEDRIATSPGDYMGKALFWGTQPEARVEFREQLKERASVVFDDDRASVEWERLMIELAHSDRC